ncbi:MAG: carboxypeptidase regulatory-like domain-containing protein [Candidatus Iainarchaeum archaeon]|uniref:Carboxypeptidase regulatory-like domain-containing protein n=1 Tax=Candidatus Iainarchaeum sp. TaxID=3101447 RepID=A0A7T9DKP7_9ARCH|nr:MAG: carboxypeptidase regulatory-like domain-containing protein [Candidatus Diapherotrites archaeon]
MAENGIWARMEDGWYSLLDKIDPVLPVYRVIDPIDEKVPSLAVVLGIVALILALILIPPLLGGGNANAVVTLRNERSEAVQNVDVLVTYNDYSETLTTNSLGNIVVKNIPIGTEVTFQADYPGYEPLTITRTISESNPKFSLAFTPLAAAARGVTIQFTDITGLSLSGKTLNVALSCTNSSVKPTPANAIVSNGVLTVTPPKDCGTLIASVNGNGFVRQDSILLSGNTPVVQLQSIELPKGRVRVRVQDAQGNFLENMRVELIATSTSSNEATLFTNTLGTANFNDVAIGGYYASVADPNGDYATKTSDTIEVLEGVTQEINVEMSKSIKGTITVQVKKKGASTNIANALVKLIRKSDNKLIATQQTNASGNTVSFAVEESGPYVITAEQDNYLSNSIESGTINGDKSIILELEALTPQNSGIVRIRVKDEEGLPVDNAQVVLYESGSGFIALQYSPKVTDVNGLAKFSGVKAGNYFARVFKYPAGPSDSPSFATQLAIPTEQDVTLQIGVATVQVKVKDPQGGAIPFANVEFLTDGTDECLPGKCQLSADAQGIASKAFKADRKIFVRVTATGYSASTSLAYQLFPGATQTINIKLENTITGNTPIIDLVQVQETPSGAIATEMKAGRVYRLLFRLKVPSSLVGEEGGVHVRVGDEALLENDVMRIVSINAPQTQIVKGTSYTPPNGTTTDEPNITFSDAKWATLNWNDLPAGTYEVGVNVRVEETTPLLESLPIYYRAWVVKNNGDWIRAPQDAVLGIAEQTGQRGSLYAETYSKIFHQGESIACEGDFCFTGEQLFNATDSLYVQGPPFAFAVNKNYRYEFVLTSNTSSIYSNTKLRMFVSNGGSQPTEELTITGYAITTPNGQLLSAQNLSTNDIPGGEGQGLATGELRQYQTISGNVQFLAEQTGNTRVVLQLINEGQIVFTKEIQMAIDSSDTLSIDVDPATAGAFLPTTFTVHVTDSQGFDIQDALVTLRRISPNNQNNLIQSLYTDIQGKVTMIGPPSLPRTRFEFDAAKAGYSSNPVTVTVDENIVAFEPQTLNFNLPATPNASAFAPLRIINKTQTPLVLQNAQISGEFQGFLANGEMQNYVNQYEGQFSLAALENKSIQVKAATSSTVNPINNESLNGFLVLTFSTQGTQQLWVQRIPLRVNLELVGSCDGPAIELSGAPTSGEIQTTSFDNKSQIQFQVSNVCEKDGVSTVMRNLKSRITWKSNPIGNVELALSDLEGGQQAVEVLRSGAYVPFFDSFKTAETTPYAGILTFTPFPGNIGKDAEFTIDVAGELAGQGGTKTLSKSFNVKIKVTNLETCLVLNPEPEEGVVMKSNEDEVEFEVDSTKCGNVPLDIAFCQGANNVNCSGGSPEGRLQLSRYTISDLTAEKKTVTIQRTGSTLPGTYDVTVHARVPGTQYRQIASLVTRIESDSSYAFDLDKSQFILYQQSAIDSATVTNRLLQEVVQVTASACDWEEAAKRSPPYLLAAGVGVGVGFGVSIFASASVLASTGFGLAAAVIVIAIASLLSDPCDEKLTHPLNDYIINLTGGDIGDMHIAEDAQDIVLDQFLTQHIAARWNTKVSNVFKKGSATYQTVGMELENLSGFTDPNPLFGVATLRAREHIQGDISHSGDAAVECDNSSFGPYQIGPSSSQGSCSPASDDTILEEKFHIKIRTQDINQTLPELEFDSVACVSGNELGSSGNGALPKVAFNWRWDDTQGIPINACDALNGNAIYCDATQFNITMMKRLHALDEFLAANGYNFTCPTNPIAQQQQASFPSANTVPIGYIGINRVGYSFTNPTTLQVSVDVNNLTTAAQDVSFTATIGTSATSNAPTIPNPCSTSQNIAANGSAHLQCTISGLGISDAYYVEYAIASTTTTNVAFGQPIIQISTQSVQQQANGTCEDLPKSTVNVGGAPIINRWIDPTDPLFGSYVNDNSIVWTNAVPNVQALNTLLHYDAYLIRDGFSTDFENDFKEFYTNNSFADAPTWFKSNTPTIGTLNKYYSSNDDLYFTNKYFDSPTLPSAGKYHIDLDVLFNGTDWRFFNAQGEPTAKIRAVFYHLNNPSPNSPFYRTPFDGLVGVNGTQYERVGYGLEYINEDGPLKVNDSTVLTYPGGNSSALANLEVRVADDIRRLNSLPSSRGTLLELTAASGSGTQEMIFSPRSQPLSSSKSPSRFPPIHSAHSTRSHKMQHPCNPEIRSHSGKAQETVTTFRVCPCTRNSTTLPIAQPPHPMPSPRGS